MTGGISQAVSDVIAPRNIIIPTITNVGAGNGAGQLFISGSDLCWISGVIIRKLTSRDL